MAHDFVGERLKSTNSKPSGEDHCGRRRLPAWAVLNPPAIHTSSPGHRLLEPLTKATDQGGNAGNTTPFNGWSRWWVVRRNSVEEGRLARPVGPMTQDLRRADRHINRQATPPKVLRRYDFKRRHGSADQTRAMARTVASGPGVRMPIDSASRAAISASTASAAIRASP